MVAKGDTLELHRARGVSIDDMTECRLTPTSHLSAYDTKHQKSLIHYLTREALPTDANYRNLASIVDGPKKPRPTLDELHNATYHEEVSFYS